MHSILEIKGCNNQIIRGNKWLIDGGIHKTIVLVHGMNEYSFRYNEFSLFLNENGYDVFALDHLGHGLNVSDPKQLLVWPKNGFKDCVENINILINKLKQEGREIYVFAHSMGSFMGQCLIENYPDCTKKIVLCGTSGPQPFIHKVGALLTRFHRLITINNEKPSHFLNFIAFASYNSKIKNKRTSSDWLSVNETNVDNYIKDPMCGAIPSRNFFASFIGSIPALHKKKNIAKINKDLEVLFIVGDKDPVGNYTKSIKKLQNLYIGNNISSQLIIYKNMRHEILNEDGHEKIFSDILNFYDKKIKL